MLLHDWAWNGRPDQQIPWGDWPNWVILAGRGWGKMLADSTPLPTPSGWTTMAEVAVGDKLIDENGYPCTVTAKFSPVVSSQYRFTFSDRSEIETCAEHQWVTWTHSERKAFLRSPYEDVTQFPVNWPQWRLKRLTGRQVRKDVVIAALELHKKGLSARKIAIQLDVCRTSLAAHLKAGVYLERTAKEYLDSPGPKIRTTQEIVDTLRFGKRGDNNHCVPCAAPLKLPKKVLPIDPYVLGAWLGDGTSKDGTFTAHENDQNHLIGKLAKAGFAPKVSSRDTQRVGTTGLRVKLREAGVLNDKHIPPAYLRSATHQRLELVRGLMDTDGNIEGDNSCAFVNTNKKIIDAFEELIVSLGMKATVNTGVGYCNGKKGKRYWRVNFTPTINPFSMPRKFNRLRLGGKQSLRNHHRMIIKAERIDPVAMSCVTVDSPNSMYLASRAMIPTHNTRTGAETVREWIKTNAYVNLIGPTADDARDVMVEGESGILAICPSDERPTYLSHKRQLQWPNGAKSLIFTAEEPERLRGKQSAKLWCDELAAWRYPEAWDQASFGLRLGKSPQAVITTTPKPTKIIKQLVADPRNVVTRGSTYDNQSNLASAFLTQIARRYEGTRLGRQELNAEILLDNPGALWKRDWIEETRVKGHPELNRIVVAIDPAVTSSSESAETGIIVAGIATIGGIINGYTLHDGSMRGTPDEWARRAVALYHQYGADRIVGETNNGGDMIETIIRTVDRNVAYKGVHASRGKQIRAEPISALYEQKRVHHVGMFAQLEDQLCDWDPSISKESPDRLDALVWALTELMASDQLDGFIQYYQSLAKK